QRAENQHRALHHFIHKFPPAARGIGIRACPLYLFYSTSASPFPARVYPTPIHPRGTANIRRNLPLILHRVILPSPREFIHKPVNASSQHAFITPALPNG